MARLYSVEGAEEEGVWWGLSELLPIVAQKPGQARFAKFSHLRRCEDLRVLEPEAANIVNCCNLAIHVRYKWSVFGGDKQIYASISGSSFHSILQH